jgi:hypothetical protein
MQYIDISNPCAQTSLLVDLLEITGGKNTVATACRLQQLPGKLILTVIAQDPDPFSLIATEPLPGKPDQFLYEEDCIHLAISLPGQPQPADFSLINPRGSRKGSKGASNWDVQTSRSQSSWEIKTTIPLPTDAQAIGLLLVRFFRGIHGELHGLSPALPHPMDVTTFTPVLLCLPPNQTPDQAAAHFSKSADQAASEHLQSTLQSVRARMTKNLAIANRPRITLDHARQHALALLESPVPTTVRALSWGEQYVIHSLIDLWQLDLDRQWLNHAITRCESVWDARAHLQNRADSLWHQVMPTWYDADGLDNSPITLGTGAIIYPIARLFHLIHSTPDLADLRPRLSHWDENFRLAIAAHDREWIDLPAGQGNYLEPDGKGPRRLYPTGGSRICPLNRSFYLAMPLMFLAQHLNQPIYMDRVKKMARYFKNSCQLQDNGALVWEYLTSRYPATGEDVSHATSQVTFAHMLADAGIEFTTADLQAMALTLKHNILRHHDVPCEYLRAVEPGFSWYLGLWAPLTRYVPETLPALINLVEAAMAEGHPHTKMPWGLRNTTSLLLAQKQLWPLP